jgi:2,3-dihydroxyphenylpropionate 1,2-dioxygenase
VSSDLSTKLIRHLQSEGFDPAFSSDAEIDYAFGIPLDFLGITGPIIPLWVNAYVPPQPSVERCYAFGQALERGLSALGVRAAVVTSGGLSHFPGTERYSEPDTEFDRELLAEMETGNLRWLLSLDEKRLDDTGNVEVRCWAVTAGMLGQRKPDMSSFDPSWHHNYATLAWYTEPGAVEESRHYPAVAPEHVGLMRVLHVLAHDADARTRYLDDPEAFARAQDIDPEEQKALASLDQETMIGLGVHPFLPFMARMWLDRQREQK